MFRRAQQQMFVVRDSEGRVRTLRHNKARAEQLAKEIKANTMEWYWMRRPDMPESAVEQACEMQVVPA